MNSYKKKKKRTVNPNKHTRGPQMKFKHHETAVHYDIPTGSHVSVIKKKKTETMRSNAGKRVSFKKHR